MFCVAQCGLFNGSESINSDNHSDSESYIDTLLAMSLRPIGYCYSYGCCYIPAAAPTAPTDGRLLVIAVQPVLPIDIAVPVAYLTLDVHQLP